MLAAALVMGAFAACGNTKDKASNKGGNNDIKPVMKSIKSSEDGSSLTLDVPKTWKNNTDTVQTAASISMLSAEKDEALVVIEEKVADFEPKLKLAKYADMIVQVMQKTEGTSNWQVGDLFDTTVGSDTPAKQREISVSLNGVNIKYLQTVFKTKNSFVEILESTTPSKFDTSKKVFLDILTTVNF
jgi:hypothetical protein